MLQTNQHITYQTFAEITNSKELQFSGELPVVKME